MLKILELILLTGLSFGVAQAVEVNGIIAGTIKDSTGKPLDSVTIIIENDKHYISKSDGTFFIDSLTTGTTKVEIRRNGYIDHKLLVNVSSTTPEITVVLKPGTYTSIKGVVKDTSGKPVADVTVGLGQHEKTTGFDGIFCFERVLTSEKYWHISSKLYRDSSFVLTAENTPADMKIIAVPSLFLPTSIFVKDYATGKPIEGVFLELGEYHIGTGVHWVKTDSNGTYSFNSLKVVRWAINLYKSGYQKISTDFFLKTEPSTLFYEMIPEINTGIIEKNATLTTVPSLRYSSGILTLVNIKEPGEISVFNLNGKLLFRQKFNSNSLTIPLPKNVISNKTTQIVNINAGKYNLRQLIAPMNWR